jgi:bifunctional hydroxylase/dehydrase
MDAFDADVLVVGAGPTGLMVAGELRLAGVTVITLDRLAEPMRQSRALGFSARAVEEFGQRGLLSTFGALEAIPLGHFGGIPLDYRIVAGGHFGPRGFPQSRTEAILAEWATGLGADLRRSHEVTGLDADDQGVTAEVTTPAGVTRLRARYLVGCDGARSSIRQLSGIPFRGTDATMEMQLADVTGVRIPLRPSGQRGEAGVVLVLPSGPDVTRVVVFERGAGVRVTPEPPAFPDVAAAFERVTGEDIHAATPIWTSSFTDASRQAASYRTGRVFLAGDAAHVHLPIGAQGISAGVGDAVNLGWKLAAAISGHAPADLLDTYQSERYPVGAGIIANTLVQRYLYLGGPEMQGLRDIFNELIKIDAVQRYLVGAVTGLGTSYDMGHDPDDGDHALVGRRLADQELIVGDAKTTTHHLLHRGHAILLDLHDSADLRQRAAAWADRVDIITAACHGPATLPAGLLVRPDGYVAWGRSDGSVQGLTGALTRWFGAPRVGA